MFRLVFLVAILCSSLAVSGQTEILNNTSIIEMSRAGLPVDIIIKKVGSSRTDFDTSAPGLIELKTSGVADDVIAAMMERNDAALPGEPERAIELPLPASEKPPLSLTREHALGGAKTIAFSKSSLAPSRQALEKELMKRKDFQQLNLAISRYKETADLYVEIGFVSGSWITHRYVYRIYDRKSGAVISAGETTSWGSLAENLARHIAKSLAAARSGKMACTEKAPERFFPANKVLIDIQTNGNIIPLLYPNWLS